MSIIFSKEKDGTINVQVAGKVSRDPEIKQAKNGTKIRFGVNYGKKKFINVEAWEDGEVGRIANALEKGDPVLAAGTYETWEYNDQQYSVVRADFITPIAMPSAPAQPAPAPTQKKDDFVVPTGFTELDDDFDDSELPF